MITNPKDVTEQVANLNERLANVASDHLGRIKNIQYNQEKLAVANRQILEIFTTLRIDPAPINGAYDCDGREFNADDFQGDNNPYDLLVAGKAPTVTYAKYSEITSASGDGNCGYFGLDTINRKFKVPTITRFLEPGWKDGSGNVVVGKDVEAGLPDIEGNLNNVYCVSRDSAVNTGAFASSPQWSSDSSYVDGTAPNWNITANGSELFITPEFKAANHNSIYGNSTTVQPNSIKVRVMVQLSNVKPELSLNSFKTDIDNYIGKNVYHGKMLGEYFSTEFMFLPHTDAIIQPLGQKLLRADGYGGIIDEVKRQYKLNAEMFGAIEKRYTFGCRRAEQTYTSLSQNGVTVSGCIADTELLKLLNGSEINVTLKPWAQVWFQFSFDRLVFMQQYFIHSDNGVAEYPKAWKVYGSIDGSTWEEIVSVTGQTFSLDQKKTYDLPVTKPYQHYKIQFSDGVEESEGNGELKQIGFMTTYDAVMCYMCQKDGVWHMIDVQTPEYHQYIKELYDYYLEEPYVGYVYIMNYKSDEMANQWIAKYDDTFGFFGTSFCYDPEDDSYVYAPLSHNLSQSIVVKNTESGNTDDVSDIYDGSSSMAMSGKAVAQAIEYALGVTKTENSAGGYTLNIGG